MFRVIRQDVRSLQVSQQQTPSLVGLADNIDSKTIFTHNLDIFDTKTIKTGSIANNVDSKFF